METIKSLVNKSTQELSSTKTPSKRWPHLQKKADDLLTCHSHLASFCTMFNPDLQPVVADNLDRAMFGSAPMLCTIDAAYGDGSATQWLIPQLHNLCVTVGVKTKLDDVQLRQLAQMIRKEFGYLKATEVMLFVWRFKAGHYGELYGAVDPVRIMRALRGRFCEERARRIELHEREQHELEKQQWAETAATPAQIEEIKKRFNNQ
jgi:hypothetical protein